MNKTEWLKLELFGLKTRHRQILNGIDRHRENLEEIEYHIAILEEELCQRLKDL